MADNVEKPKTKDPKVVEGDIKAAEESNDEGNSADVSIKWKWEWRSICFVAVKDEEGEDESMAIKEVSMDDEYEEGKSGDSTEASTTSGVKRKVETDSVDRESEETPEKKLKLSDENLAILVRKLDEI